jgi:hypothetical protein
MNQKIDALPAHQLRDVVTKRLGRSAANSKQRRIPPRARDRVLFDVAGASVKLQALIDDLGSDVACKNLRHRDELHRLETHELFSNVAIAVVLSNSVIRERARRFELGVEVDEVLLQYSRFKIGLPNALRSRPNLIASSRIIRYDAFALVDAMPLRPWNARRITPRFTVGPSLTRGQRLDYLLAANAPFRRA